MQGIDYWGWIVGKYLGEMLDEASGDFPYVVSDLDVNRTMSLV